MSETLSRIPTGMRLAMKSSLDIIKPRVRALLAYKLSPHRASVKVNQNENPWDAPAPIKKEVQRRLEARQWSRYPDFVPVSLHVRLAGFQAGDRTASLPEMDRT